MYTASSQRCFTQPGCFEENVIVTTEFDCCMQGQLILIKYPSLVVAGATYYTA